MTARGPLPPFTEQTARQKIQAAEDAWNTRDPRQAALAYTQGSAWRSRGTFVTGRDATVAFMPRGHAASGHNRRAGLAGRATR